MNLFRACWISLAIAAIAPSQAYAVCFYPGTDQSGYRVPLDEEAKDSRFVIIGKVMRVELVGRPGSEPRTLRYEVKRLRTVRGPAPKRFTFESNDDSGGYRMAMDETHVLFVRSSKAKRYSVDSCGNSEALPAGQKTVDALRALH